MHFSRKIIKNYYSKLFVLNIYLEKNCKNNYISGYQQVLKIIRPRIKNIIKKKL